MRIDRKGKAQARRVSGPRIAVSLAIGTMWLAGCAGGQALELGEGHPASPRATPAGMTASAALTRYRTPADFAARLAEAPGTSAASGHGGGGHGAAGPPVAQADGAPASGVGTLNGVNPERRTVSISHEPIPGLGWPAMTMDLPVAPSVDLTIVGPGSRVRFTVRRGADGLYAIDSLAPGPASVPSPPEGSAMPGMGHGGGGGGAMPGHGGTGGHQ